MQKQNHSVQNKEQYTPHTQFQICGRTFQQPVLSHPSPRLAQPAGVQPDIIQAHQFC